MRPRRLTRVALAALLLAACSSPDLLRRYEGHEGAVVSVAFVGTSARVLSGDWDGVARLWDAHSGATTAVLRDPDRSPPRAVCGVAAISPDGTVIAQANHDVVHVWTRALFAAWILTRNPTSAAIDALGFAPDGRLLLAERAADVVHVVDIGAQEDGLAPTRRLRYREDTQDRFGPRPFSPRDGADLSGVRFRREGDRLLLEGANGLACAPDGRRVAVACRDGAVRLLDLETAEVRGLRGHGDEVEAVAFSADGRLLASAGQDGTARVWDLESGSERLRLPADDDRVRAVAFSPDGKLLATAGEDARVRLWSLPRGDLVRELRGHDERVRALAFSADGRLLASGGSDRTVIVWALDPGLDD